MTPTIQEPAVTPAPTDAPDLAATLAEMNRKLDHMSEIVDDMDRRWESISEMQKDFMPMVNGIFGIVSRRLVELEENGALAFGREGVKLLETVATSFDEEDVRLLGQNLVHILTTVRNLTQPEVLDVADRAAVALRGSEAAPPKKVKLFKSLRDPEVRKGMTVMMAVLKELGSETNDAPATAGANR